MEQTSWAREDIGEHRSPKKPPERIAPPRSSGLTPAVCPTSIQITPMVLNVPKEVPVRKDMTEHSKKVQRIKYWGWMNRTEW